MSEPVFIPAEGLQLVNLENAKSGHLLWSVNHNPTLFWIVENDGRPIAIFLTGAHAGVGFETAKNEAWSGVLVGPVEVKVDVTSAHDGRKSDVGLVVENGAVATHAKMQVQGIEDWVPVTVAQVTTLVTRSLYFSRFSLGLTECGEWRELAKYDEGKWCGAMVPTEPQ